MTFSLFSTCFLGFYVENLFVVQCEVLDDCLAVLEEGMNCGGLTLTQDYCTCIMMSIIQEFAIARPQKPHSMNTHRVLMDS